ncbi:MAG: OmpA family protein [Gammaproteobacteria bacterium]|nr:OmpA family protein [Gammaproteobacteria bacterium]
MIKLKKILSLGVLTIGVMTLAACSSTRHAPSGGAMGSSTYEGSDVDNSVLNGQGLGGDASLTGVDGQTSLSVEQLLAIHTYHFAYDSAEILASDKPAVIAEAQYLAAHPNQHILLAGNTDSRGSREYNIALGWRRAQSVEDLMLLMVRINHRFSLSATVKKSPLFLAIVTKPTSKIVVWILVMRIKSSFSALILIGGVQFCFALPQVEDAGDSLPASSASQNSSSSGYLASTGPVPSNVVGGGKYCTERND